MLSRGGGGWSKQEKKEAKKFFMVVPFVNFFSSHLHTFSFIRVFLITKQRKKLYLGGNCIASSTLKSRNDVH